jgi:hypothetical protein
MCCQMYRTSDHQYGALGRPGCLTKRVIKLVFPTLCSPRNTSLNFFSGFEDDEKSADAGVCGVDMMKECVGVGTGKFE